jgi:hypothetical protein
LKQAGQPLDKESRNFFEPHFGRDLAEVRVHTSPLASESAHQLDARAFTVGQHIHFAAGQYDPASTGGRQLLAHELAHTAQQQGSPSQSSAGLEVSQPGDALEIEADRVTQAVSSGNPAQPFGVGTQRVARQGTGAAEEPAKPGDKTPAVTASSILPFNPQLPGENRGWEGDTILKASKIDPGSKTGKAIATGPEEVWKISSEMANQTAEELKSLKTVDEYWVALLQASLNSSVFSLEMTFLEATYGELDEFAKLTDVLSKQGQERRTQLVAWSKQPKPKRVFTAAPAPAVVAALAAQNVPLGGAGSSLVTPVAQPGAATIVAGGAATAAPGTKAEVFDATEATAVKDKWAKEGATSESDIARQLDTFKKWRDKHSRAVNAAKKAKVRALTDDQLTTVATWLGTYETHEQWKAVGAGKEPADPGTAPAELAQLGGNPPTPAFEKIKQYDVTVPGGSTFSYKDHVKSAFTKRDTGVGDVGTVGGSTKIADVFDKAGVTAPDTAMVKKAFSVLSDLEGKFDAINTYDAGFISAGFIQFISGAGGNESLAKVLRDMKAKNPTDFTTDFHNLGIDVDAKGLVVVDPADGTILHGEDAVQKVIADKRLTAVFQQAGKSDSFQHAQARIAYEQYYVPDKSFSIDLTVKETDPAAKKKTRTVTVTVTGKYKDVLLSEAGKVAIVDRGVQRGTGGKTGSQGAAGRFLDACQAVVTKHDLTAPTAAELAKYESEIVPKLVNRYEVLADTTLSQPAAAPAATSAVATPVQPAPTP